MVEYTIDINDNPAPKSRLRFLKALQKFLSSQKKYGTIKGYSLKTPYKSITLFKVEAKK